ncbi:hypothetical protein ATN83_3379 [Raoultella ornithinolytica]|nr:hypothetical protein ATN83_3379 [Raoultella ornithinolytica]
MLQNKNRGQFTAGTMGNGAGSCRRGQRLATTLRRAISRGQRGAAARSDNDPADSL